METLEQFVERLSNTVGCYNHPNEKKSLYSLKKFPSNVRGKMGVFGWVSDKKRINRFRVSTYKHLADQHGIEDSDEKKECAHFGRKAGIFYFIAKGSTGVDFQKTVRALKVIQSNKQ